MGSFPANGYELYDMAGNVWEWCNDRWDSAYYDYSPTSNPRGPTSGTRRVLRGGGWGNGAVNGRVACRHKSLPDNWFFRSGFRVVLDLAACPSADLTSDCFVDYEDFAPIVAQWLTTDPCVLDDMAYIRGGTFEMGDHFNKGESDELPVHTVTVDSFYMGRYEITNEEYCAFLNDANSLVKTKVASGIVYASFNKSNSYPYCDTSTATDYSQIAYSGGVFSVRTKSGRDMSNDPVGFISWYGAAAYCNWRSRQEGYQRCYNLSTWDCDFSKKGYRLATEAEWEYAARGGAAGRHFPWGHTISHNQANYWSSSGYSYDMGLTKGYHPAWNDGVFPCTSPVGSFPANGYELYDMAGNVWEWCNDRWDSDYYDYSPTNNPTGPTSGTSRVIRGGGWRSYAYYCRVARRYGPWPGARFSFRGFRVVLDLN